MRGEGKVRGGDDSRSFGGCLYGLVPDDEAMLIEAGEKSGDVSVGLTNAVTMVTAKKSLMDSIKKSMAKPLGYVVAMIGVLMFFSFKLMPQFEANKPRATWPKEAQLLGSVADHVVAISFGVILLLVLIIVLLQFVLPRWHGDGREWCDRYVFPFNIIAGITGASLLTSVAAYATAGIPFVSAISYISRGATPYMQSQCNYISLSMRNGRREAEALCNLSIIAPRFHWIITVYGMATEPASAYTNISQELVRGVISFVNNLFNLFVGNVLLMAIVSMVIWIYSSMFGIALAGNSVFGG
jgi:type II secretory pathway component PulF